MSFYRSQQEMWDGYLCADGPDGALPIPHWAGNILYAVIAFICKICFRYTVYGRHNLRAFENKSGAVVVGNHTSYLDVVFYYISARPRQWIRFMARDNFFPKAHGLVGQIFSRVGAFPVKRDSADKAAIKRAAHMLKQGELVGVFPEGSRRGKGSCAPRIHAGAAFIARMGKVPIIPATVRGAENIKRPGERIRFMKVSVEYGKPVLLEDFNFVEKDKRLEACSWYVMRECFALSLQCEPSEVDMVALFPEDEDWTQFFSEHPIAVHDAAEVADCYAFRKHEQAKAVEK